MVDSWFWRNRLNLLESGCLFIGGLFSRSCVSCCSLARSESTLAFKFYSISTLGGAIFLGSGFKWFWRKGWFITSDIEILFSGSELRRFWTKSCTVSLMWSGSLNLPFLIFRRVSCTLGHSKGGVPVRRAYRMHPKLHKSLCSPYGYRSKTSGDI